MFNEDVDVIGGTIDLKRDSVEGSNDSAHVGQQTGFDDRVDMRKTVFGAENDVDEKVGESVGQEVNPFRKGDLIRDGFLRPYQG